MYKIYKEILHSDQGGFKMLEKVVYMYFKRNFMAHFRELSEDEGVSRVLVLCPFR